MLVPIICLVGSLIFGTYYFAGQYDDYRPSLPEEHKKCFPRINGKFALTFEGLAVPHAPECPSTCSTFEEFACKNCSSSLTFYFDEWSATNTTIYYPTKKGISSSVYYGYKVASTLEKLPVLVIERENRYGSIEKGVMDVNINSIEVYEHKVFFNESWRDVEVQFAKISRAQLKAKSCARLNWRYTIDDTTEEGKKEFSDSTYLVLWKIDDSI